MYLSAMTHHRLVWSLPRGRRCRLNCADGPRTPSAMCSTTSTGRRKLPSPPSQASSRAAAGARNHWTSTGWLHAGRLRRAASQDHHSRAHGHAVRLSRLSFSGYTDGTHKESVDGLLSSGDTGHFNADGLWFVDGRDDDMIVSGGENVFPLEVENLLAEHPIGCGGRRGWG